MVGVKFKELSSLRAPPSISKFAGQFCQPKRTNPNGIGRHLNSNPDQQHASVSILSLHRISNLLLLPSIRSYPSSSLQSLFLAPWLRTKTRSPSQSYPQSPSFLLPSIHSSIHRKSSNKLSFSTCQRQDLTQQQQRRHLSSVSIGTAYEHLVHRTLSEKLQITPILHTGKTGDKGVDLVGKWVLRYPHNSKTDKLESTPPIIHARMIIQCKGIGLFSSASASVATSADAGDIISPTITSTLPKLSDSVVLSTPSRGSTLTKELLWDLGELRQLSIDQKAAELRNPIQKPVPRYKPALSTKSAGSSLVRALDGTFSKLQDWVLDSWFAGLNNYEMAQRMEGNGAGNNENSQDGEVPSEVSSPTTIGMLVTPVPASKALQLALSATSTPMMFTMLIPPTGQANNDNGEYPLGHIKQLLWNKAAADAGLGKLIPLVLTSEVSPGEDIDSTRLEEEIILALKDDPRVLFQRSGL